MCLRGLYHTMLSVSYIFWESWVFCLLLLCSLIMCTNDKVHYDPMVVFVCLLATLYIIITIMRTYMKVLKFLNSYQVNSVSNVCLRLSPFSQLSLMKYMDGLCVFGSPFSLVIVRICVLYLLIIIKSEVCPICHCLGLGHEIMVHAAWFFIFLSIGPQGNLSEILI